MFCTPCAAREKIFNMKPIVEATHVDRDNPEFGLCKEHVMIALIAGVDVRSVEFTGD